MDDDYKAASPLLQKKPRWEFGFICVYRTQILLFLRPEPELLRKGERYWAFPKWMRFSIGCLYSTYGKGEVHFQAGVLDNATTIVTNMGINYASDILRSAACY